LSSLSQRSDEELAQLTQGGDLQAFDQLSQRYWTRIQRLLMSMLDHDAAKDATQESLLRAYHKIHLYDPQKSFAPWLFTIARRVGLNERKRKSKRREDSIMDHHLPSNEESTENTLLEPLWELASEVLNDTSYQAMRLHYAEEFSIREIAKIMRKTETGIKVVLFRARQKLQAKAKDRRISL
jgi:RNA polymerase sigma-70 factor (ECF subfamily)